MKEGLWQQLQQVQLPKPQSGGEVVKVETDGVVLQMSPQAPGSRDYFGAVGPGQPLVGGVESGAPSKLVRAVGQGWGGHGVGSPPMQALVSAPALLALQQNMKVPYFDGSEGKWIPFLKEW